MKRKKLFFIFAVLTLITSLFFVFTSCDTGGGGGSPAAPGDSSRLYITDTFNGNVYTYDIDSGTVSSTPLLSTGQNATGKIYFYNGIGYIAVGAWMNDPGVYYFDPNDAVPAATRIGDAISAQYIAFYSATKAYVTDANWGSSTGVYTFDPSDPSAGLTGPLTGTAKTDVPVKPSRYLQDIRVGYDGYIYVADYNDGGGIGQVLQIDPETDTVTDFYDMTAYGTTGLLAGRGMGGTSILYVANGGSYDADWNPLPGSVDSITPSTGDVSRVVEDIKVTSLAYDSDAYSMYAVGSSNTYIFTPAGQPPWTVTEILDADSTSFGGGDLLIQSGFVYIPVFDFSTKISKLYVIDCSTAKVTDYSPVSIMVDGEDGATAVAVYEP